MPHRIALHKHGSIKLNRRDWHVRSLLGAAAIGIQGTMPLWLRAAADAVAKQDEKVLVVVQLTGGNDGLNTVVPFREDAYYRARPKLALPADRLLKLDDQFGLHPAMTGLRDLVDKGRFSIVHGVGYPTPNRSHFESMDVWHSCQQKSRREREGWIGRWAASLGMKASGEDSPAIHFGQEVQPLALAHRRLAIPSIDSIERFRLRVDLPTASQEEASNSETAGEEDLVGFLEASTQTALRASARMSEAFARDTDFNDFPSHPFGQKLKAIARLIAVGATTRVYYVTLDGFDTHSQQPAAHEGLLRQWSEGVSALVRQMEAIGQADRVLVMSFSEFGRRVAENASEGTDHGAAAPMFFAGASLRQLHLGQTPSLEALDDGDLKYQVDFRSVYAGVLEGWLGTESPMVLGGEYSPTELFATS
ncbi:MAG: DUF1501 domain-containing protein [Pirellulaceae bacterium]